MSKYCTNNHEKYKIQYHIIFSTKYRRKFLHLIDESLIKSFYRAESLTNTWKIKKLKQDKDHIHLLIEATPKDSIYLIVQKLKQVTTYDMWRQNYKILKNNYWSGKHYLWTRGYFCSTIGDVCEKTIENYIENQG